LREVDSADAFTDRLLHGHQTAVVPGRFFEAPAHFRVALGIRADVLERGLDAMSGALRETGHLRS
jgi:aspartate/methionine/tyrosine aminotransferase